MSIWVNGRSIRSQVIGVSRYTLEISNRLQDRVQILTPPENYNLFQGLLWEQLELPRHLKPGDLLWSPANTGPLLVSNQVVTFLDVIYLEHPEWFSLTHNLWYRFLQPLLARRAIKIITISQYSHKRILDILKIPESKVIVIPGGKGREFTPATLDEINQVKAKHFLNASYLLTVSTIEPRKNLSRLFQAWRLMDFKYPGINLVVAGSWRRHVQNTGLLKELPDGVHLIGYVEDTDLPALYSGALAFVYPSVYEGFGLPPLEAMACGTPVITSKATSIPEVVGDAGLLFDPYNVEEIAQTMDRIIRDENLRQELRLKGLERAEQFSWDNTAQQVWNVLQQAADEI